MSVSKAYAKALFQAATENKSSAESAQLTSELEVQLQSVVSVVDGSKDLEVALFGPVTTAKEKALVVTEVAKKLGVNPLMQNFLVMLANKGRLSQIREIREEYGSVRLIAEGGIPGRVVSADPMEKTDIDALASAFTKRLGRKVAFQVSTDPALLAGVKVTVNGVTYDGTLRSQLQRLRDQFVVGASAGK